MRICGLVVSAPDVGASRAAWRRLGPGVDVAVQEGEPGLAALCLAVADVAATARLLERRGLPVTGTDVAVHGVTWRLVDRAAPVSGLPLDHVVVRSDDPVRATADYGGRLGLDLRLDRPTDFGFRGLFFRCGGEIVEVVVPDEPTPGEDSFGGAAWRCDVAATRTRLLAAGVDVSPVRRGRKPGTAVATVRDPNLVVPTLLVGPSGD